MSYEFDAKKYEKASTHQKEWGNKLVAELELLGNERILDLGCGDGAITAELANRVPDGHVVGIDSSPAMVDLAKKKERANLTFVLQDINNIEYVDEFNVIFSNATLHWIKDHARLLGNTCRALRNGGVARFNFAGSGNCRTLFEVLHDVMKGPTFSRYFAHFVWPWFMPAVEEYKLLVAACPFSESHVWEENADRWFPDAEAITKWIDQPSLVPFLPCVGAPDRQAFRDTVVGSMLQKTRQDDGRYFETFRRINAVLRK